MPLFVNGLQVVTKGNYHFWQASSRTTVETVWGRLGPRFDPRLTRSRAVAMLATPQDNARAWTSGHGLDTPTPGRAEQEFRVVLTCLAGWITEGQTRRFANDDEIARALVAATNVQQRRNNYQTTLPEGDENKNIHQVIYGARLPPSSIGYAQRGFFDELGDDQNELGSEARQIEQEYLLQNMVKAALYEAAEIAQRYNVGISARGTGLLAHMGIESGDPTKAQEFKNKTSKEADLFLCDEMEWKDLGSVVHYDPRNGWRSDRAALEARTGALRDKKATQPEWLEKRAHVRNFRIPQLRALGGRVKIPEGDSQLDSQLKQTFMDRAAEYVEEDNHYRLGHYAAYTEIVGIQIRVKQRPHQNMYGDHDLFGFTKFEYGRLVIDTIAPLRSVQIALQMSNTFQAQHGGIWNWVPTDPFNMGIKDRIMASHSSPKGDPLVYVLPGFKVHAAFYVPGVNVLRSVWDYPEAVEWKKKTPTGKHHFERTTGMLPEGSSLLGGFGFGS